MSTEVPPLRAGVTVRPDPARGRPGLVDPVLGQRVGLDPTLASIVGVADRSQTVAEAASRSGLDPAVVERAVAALKSRHLLDTPEARQLAADAEAAAEVARADPAEVPLLIRDDAAFECTMCGSCCGGHNIGPVFDDTLAGLEPHTDALTRATGATSGLFVTMPGPGGGAPRALCRSREGWCVFLGDDGGCVIHRDLGGDMKPRSCQLFPFEFTATPAGVAVSISSECRDLRRAAETGPAIRNREAHIRALLAKVPSGHLDRLRPVLRLDGSTPLTYAQYAALEERLHAAVDAHSDAPSSALLAMGAVAGGSGPPRTPSPAELATELESLTSDLASSLQAVRDELHRDGPGFVNRADGLDPMIDAIRGLRRELERVVAPPRDPAVSEVFALTTHQRLMGKELCEGGTLQSGLARLAWSWLVARSLMIRSARSARRFHVTGDDAMDAMVAVTFLHRTEPVKRLLQPHDAQLQSLCLHDLPTLVASAGDLAEHDERVELVSF